MGTTVFSDSYTGKQDVLAKAQASDRVTKTGRPYNNAYCIVLKVSDDKVAEIDEYCDTDLITSVFGSK